MKRVTGIGGIFFSAKDPAALRAWYKRHLGIDVQDDDQGSEKLTQLLHVGHDGFAGA